MLHHIQPKILSINTEPLRFVFFIFNISPTSRMQREKDYLKKKIDRLASMLGKLIAQAFQTDPPINVTQLANDFDQLLQQEKGLSLTTLQNLSNEIYIDTLKNNYAISPTQMPLIADMIMYLTDSQLFGEQTQNKDLYQKVILLYEQALQEGVALPLDKFTWLDALKKRIKTQS